MIYLLPFMAAAVLGSNSLHDMMNQNRWNQQGGNQQGGNQQGGKDQGKDEEVAPDYDAFIKGCVDDAGTMGKTCQKDTDCGECGTTCEVVWGTTKGCAQCKDAGTEETCLNEFKRDCWWTGDECLETEPEMTTGMTDACMRDGNFAMAKSCNSDEDCDCGLNCFDYFGAKTCMMCPDYGEEDVESCLASPRGCIFDHGFKTCIKKTEMNMTPEERVNKCADEKNFEIGSSCKEHKDCPCTMSCEGFDLGFSMMNACTACADFGIEEDCLSEKFARECVWKDDLCHESPNWDGENIIFKKAILDNKTKPEDTEGCAKLSGKKCKKSKVCMLDETDECIQNYFATCMGNNEDLHGKCHKLGKEDCLAECKVNPFNQKKTCFCTWGKNTMDREADNRACMEREKVASCKTTDDCKCGTSCVDEKCMLCGDVKEQGPCDGHDSGMCKWSGDAEGACLRKDMCKELTEEPTKCNQSPVCSMVDGKCMKKTVDKKVCKKLAKKKGKKDTAEDLKKKAEACNSELNCKWSGKKCSIRKSK